MQHNNLNPLSKITRSENFSRNITGPTHASKNSHQFQFCLKHNMLEFHSLTCKQDFDFFKKGFLVRSTHYSNSRSSLHSPPLFSLTLPFSAEPILLSSLFSSFFLSSLLSFSLSPFVFSSLFIYLLFFFCSVFAFSLSSRLLLLHFGEQPFSSFLNKTVPFFSKISICPPNFS